MKAYYPKTTANTSVVNTMMCLDAAIVEHYANMLFKEDTSRIVYASTRRCFRERAKKNRGMLNLPFMNIYRTNITSQKAYPSWRNKAMTVGGRFISEIGAKARALPVTVSYDANVFYGERMPDSFIASGLTLQDDAYETRLKYGIPVKDLNDVEKTLNNIAVLSYNPAFDNLYSDNDYFEQNVIRNIQLDFTFDTFLFLDLDSSIGVTEEAILNIASTKNIDTEDITLEETYEQIIVTDPPSN